MLLSEKPELTAKQLKKTLVQGAAVPRENPSEPNAVLAALGEADAETLAAINALEPAHVQSVVTDTPGGAHILNVSGALAYELPAEPQKMSGMFAIAESGTTERDRQYPFYFEIVDGGVVLKITDDEVYTTLSVYVAEQTSDPEEKPETVYATESDDSDKALPIPDIATGTE